MTQPIADDSYLARALRINHAGEYGAVQIYKGQLAVLGRSAMGQTLREMLAHEEKHKAAFMKILPDYQVRPSALLPFWHVAGFALGAATALMGTKTAMACTIAVEEVIDEHYAEQITTLRDSNPELLPTLQEFRDDELHHRDLGVEHGGRQAPAFGLLEKAIKGISRIAIKLSAAV